ncbi:MAG TPA: pyrroloquinoline quinone-dependent dehydrogenase [Vicinamibacterales bacterium]|nr:pyrroloquinoline quinone-dependent dehydrogenase [Vicinamibacterales bacterium]
MNRQFRFVAAAAALTVSLAWMNADVRAQFKPKLGEWWTYGADLASTRYSPLDQINKDNFNKLEVAWRFKTDFLGPRPEFNFQSTPLMVDGVVYSTAGTRRAVVALDAATGELIWMHSENEGPRGAAAPRQLSGRGLAYWSDGRQSRIVYVTPGYRLVALDAKTGVPVSGFGTNGVVDLKTEDDQQIDLVNGEVGLHATPIIAKDVIVVGAAHLPGGAPKSRIHEKGFIRGYDARTGKRLWIFHTIPQAGEFGNDTWEKDSWSYTGNAGVWAEMTVDEELGLVYLPVELPTGDYYGGNRPGKGLFGESLVALDIKTGQRKWHFQLEHHGIWDHDIPSAPILADITVDGRRIKAIAQPTKQNWLYVFDRTNGKPVWPIEERPVAKGDVPGEWYSPTQPFVTKPPAYDRQGVSLDDLIDFTPELHQQAVDLVSKYKIGPLFTPPVVSTWPGPLGTIMLPGSTGGANWQGGSIDPESNIVYIYSQTLPNSIGLAPADPARSDFGYVQGTARDPNAAPSAGRGGRGGAPGAPGGGGRGGGEEGGGGGGLQVQGLPIIKPPYGRITAIDLNKGERVWQVAHGETADNVKNNPALKGLNIPRTGRNGRVGVLTTKTLVIAGDSGVATQPNGQRGAMLRAYDKATGSEVGAVFMAAPQTGSPMTYLHNGKQYIVIAISGGNYTGELVAYKLPG